MEPTPLKKSFIILISFAVGVMAANIYYAQPILSLVAESLGLRSDAAGLIMTFTQIGYGLGVLFIIPLGDLFENKKLILIMVAITIAAELTLGMSQSLVPYFTASILVGLGASAVQIIVPYTTHLYDKALRGQVLGTLMSGLMLGIMLSRPLASLMTDLISLHAIFFVSAGIMTLLFWRLVYALPARQPEVTNLKYGQLIWSMKQLVVDTPTLRRRAAYQALMFGAFCLFWTIAPLMLIHSAFHFTQKGVALFALAGLAGAVAAPYAGRMADKGLSRKATLLALGGGILSFLLSHFWSYS
jgi:predicted MFS family arabinose efflux permease